VFSVARSFVCECHRISTVPRFQSRRIKRSERISRTTLSCRVRIKVYVTYHAAVLSTCAVSHPVAVEQPTVSYSILAYFRLSQPKPRRPRARRKCLSAFISTQSLTKSKHRPECPTAKYTTQRATSD